MAADTVERLLSLLASWTPRSGGVQALHRRCRERARSLGHALLPAKLLLVDGLDAASLSRALGPGACPAYRVPPAGRFDAALVPHGEPPDSWLLALDSRLPVGEQVGLYAHAVAHLIHNYRVAESGAGLKLDPRDGYVHVESLSRLRERSRIYQPFDLEVLEEFPALTKPLRTSSAAGARLEDLTEGAVVLGVSQDGPVRVLSARMIGGTAVRLTYEDVVTGKPGTRVLYRSSEPSLEVVEGGGAWTYTADGALCRLALEAERIRLAHLFDPQLAVSVSWIEPLPHQISAVYETMLQRQPLRFLLADDPGAGKTIMTGLFIKELILRGDLERCVIVVPASLEVQWQDELLEKFGLHFDIVGRHEIESAAVNVFAERNLVIARIDLLKQEEQLERLSQVDWDLVVVDEAHKMSATMQPGTNKVRETARYKLGKLLSARSRHFLMLTATPHRGKEIDFQMFMQLLDPDRFEVRFQEKLQPQDVQDVMRRMMKEDLVDFGGCRLFPERRAYTVGYALSPLELQLYEEMTEYVRQEMNRADLIAAEGGQGRQRRTVVGFALTTLQRRLASSPEAIYQSLARRRRRLERTLEEERRKRLEKLDLASGYGRVEPDELETDLEESPEDEAEEIVDRASASRTIAELEFELEQLARLEALAERVRASGEDSKWQEMRTLLEETPEMYKADGSRRKLVVFTEHRDTLHYLAERIRDYLGRDDAVVTIHGGMSRDARRDAQNEFLHREESLVLVATDASGEGINLQRAHLMVNYDLPWNPNRLEQRFGRIHRFGQKEVCHNWNLLAYNTREGEVYDRLLAKLEEARKALGDTVFDVLGEVFTDRPLRELMLDAIRYGDDPAQRARLEEVVANLADLEEYRRLLEEYRLVREIMDPAQVTELAEERDRGATNRLVPHFIASFFAEAFTRLGGSITEREPGRYRISNVPPEIRRRAQRFGRSCTLPTSYTRVCFDKELAEVEGLTEAKFIGPGHPLLEATLGLVLERWGGLMTEGAVLVDPSATGEPRLLFMVRTDVTDDDGDTLSSELHFVELGAEGKAVRAGAAPYLDYRPLEPDEVHEAQALASAEWVRRVDLEAVQDYAIVHLAEEQLERVRQEREERARKVLQAVDDRLSQLVLHWDKRADELDRQYREGTVPKVAVDNARDKAAELTERRKWRLEALKREVIVQCPPPQVLAGMLVVPADRLGKDHQEPDPEALQRLELVAMREVMLREREAGYEPRDVSGERRGYDLESAHRDTGKSRFVEVKGRAVGVDTITLTRNEQLVARNKRADYVLAIVEVDGDRVVSYQAIPDPLGGLPSDGMPFGMVSSTFSIQQLQASRVEG